MPVKHKSSFQIAFRRLVLRQTRRAPGKATARQAKGVLERVAALPIIPWHCTNAVSTPHLGPMAQDFHAAFGLNGRDDKHIATVDEEVVALAAIQGLNRKVEAKEARIWEFSQKVDPQSAENADLKQHLEALERVIRKQESH